MIGTHLNHLLAAHAHRLIGQDEVQAMLDTLAETAPALAGGLVPKLMPLSTVTEVFQRLVEEGVPVRDTRTIVTALVAHAGRSPEPAELTELVRPALGPAIVQTLAGLREPVTAIALDPALESLLASAVRAAPGCDLAVRSGAGRARRRGRLDRRRDERDGDGRALCHRHHAAGAPAAVGAAARAAAATGRARLQRNSR